MIPRKKFIYYLINRTNGNAWYYDANRALQSISLTAAGTTLDVSLKNAPGGWKDTTFGFARNDKYYGLMRTYSTPFVLIKAAADMVRELVLLGVDTEVPLSMAVFKLNANAQPGEPLYENYIYTDIDIPEIEDRMQYGLGINLMEGGVAGLLKSYENTQVQIPCDGSIVENVKANLDGLLVPDTLYYQITPNIYDRDNSRIILTLPATFVNHNADNYGIVHNDIFPQQLASVVEPDAPYIFYSTSDITIKINGSIVLASVPGVGNVDGIKLSLRYITSSAVAGDPPTYLFRTGVIYTDTQINFAGTITLKAYEKLYLYLTPDALPIGTYTKTNIKLGNLSISFASANKATRAYGIGLYDCFKLIVQQVCQIATKNTGQIYNYGADSALLQQYNGILVSSADAIRASGDSSYQRFFTPQNTIGNTTYGPVIKTTLYEFFESVSAILCAALGSHQLAGQAESLFIEKLSSIFDSSVVDIDLGEVTNLKVRYNKKYTFSDLEIGAVTPQFDQVEGKYESNTVAKWKMPINAFSRLLNKVCKYVTSSYAIERWRSNIGPATSTTRNSNDNAVALISCNLQSFIYDYFKAFFNSLIPDPDATNNTNINLVQGRANQPISLPLTDGEYFLPQLDNSIIVFNKTGYSATEDVHLLVDANISSIGRPFNAPVDSVTFKLWHNGVVIYSGTFPVTGPVTAISIDQHITEAFAFSDTLYLTASTTPTGQVQINTVSVAVGTYVTASGVNIPVDTGTLLKLISYGTFVPTSTPYNNTTSVVNYGYQYFIYNSLAINSLFNLSARMAIYTQGGTGDVLFKTYINGIEFYSFGIPTQSTRTFHDLTFAFPPSYTFTPGDVIFMRIDVGTGCTCSIVEASLTMNNQTKAYTLLRVQYDSISGVPNIAKDPTTGLVSTTVAGAPFNIEPCMTPKRQLLNWLGYMNSCVLDKVTGPINFRGLDKNQYLSTTLNGVTITEAADELLLQSGAQRFFYPREVTFKTKVPLAFNKLATTAKNAHIRLTYRGNEIFVFAEDFTQKPALNEAQEWVCTLSPATSLATLANLSKQKIIF